MTKRERKYHTYLKGLKILGIKRFRYSGFDLSYHKMTNVADSIFIGSSHIVFYSGVDGNFMADTFSSVNFQHKSYD